MLIALIDDGIRNSPNYKIRYDLRVAADGSISNRIKKESVPTMHGTTCAAIINKYYPDAEFCSLQVFHDSTLTTAPLQLVSALKWCLQMSIPVIHTSLGTTLKKDYMEIRAIVAELISKNQMVIAASSNEGILSFPACINGVFGVEANKSLGGYEFIGIHSGQHCVPISASSVHTLFAGDGFSIETQISNSYAAPVVTAAICNALEKRKHQLITIKAMFSLLLKGQYAQNPYPSFANDAIVINFSEHDLLVEHLFFRVKYVITDVDSLNHLWLTCNECIVYIPDSSESDTLSVAFNRILLQNRDSISSLINMGQLTLLADKTDQLLSWNMQDYNDFLKKIPDSSEDISVPIIYIKWHGNEPIRLVCKIGDFFIREGYQCCCLSDFRFSHLYDIDYCPEGYDANRILKYIQKYKAPDIIICALSSIHTVENNQEDIEIVISQEGPTYQAKNVIRINTNWDDDEVAAIYDKIVEHYHRTVSIPPL